jgi:hypothetical protein
MYNEGILIANLSDQREFISAEALLTLDFLKIVPYDDKNLEFSYYDGKNKISFQISREKFKLPLNLELAIESYGFMTISSLNRINYEEKYDFEIADFKKYYPFI